jgi:hypothetical protein
VNDCTVPGLENINAIFDTGTTMILGDPYGIRVFFAALAPSGALPLHNSPDSSMSSGRYSSTWANLAADQSSLQYLMFFIVYF